MERPGNTVSIPYLNRFHSHLTPQKLSDFSNFLVAKPVRIPTLLEAKERKSRRAKVRSIIEMADLTDWYYKKSVLSALESGSSDTTQERILEPQDSEEHNRSVTYSPVELNLEQSIAESALLANNRFIRTGSEEHIAERISVQETLSGPSSEKANEVDEIFGELKSDIFDEEVLETQNLISDIGKDEFIPESNDLEIVGTMFLGEMLHAQLTSPHTSSSHHNPQIRAHSSMAAASEPSTDFMTEMNFPLRVMFQLLTLFFVGRLILVLLYSKFSRVIS